MTGMERAARAAQFVMGILLMVSGLVKLWEPVLFYWQIVPYTQLLGMTVHWQEFSRVGLLMAPFECALAIALLANWRPRFTMPLATLLMVFFVALMVLAWRVGATEECGCFGVLLERGPGQAAVEDTVMLALVLFGWWGAGRHSSWRRAGWLVAGGAALALLVGTVRFVPGMDRLRRSDLIPGVHLTGLRVRGVPKDPHRGEYLMELFSPRCSRCLHSVPMLNRFADQADLPQVLALSSFSTEGKEMKEFVARARPRYPIGTITRTDFFRLTWGHGFPRLAYVKDGTVRVVWEHDRFPTPAQLRALLQFREG